MTAPLAGRPRVSVLTPTRGRPSSVRRLLDSARETARDAVELVLYVDDDDPHRDPVVELAGEPDVTVITGDRCVLSEAWNRCARAATADVLMQCGDDIVFRTAAWDERVLEEFAGVDDKIILVHGRDGIQDHRVATHGFLHRRWMETVGYFVPPLFSSDYNDLWLTEVADALGRRRYLPEIYTEHLHPVAGKAPLDLTHRERLERHRRDGVDQLYARSADLRAEDVSKLQAVMA